MSLVPAGDVLRVSGGIGCRFEWMYRQTQSGSWSVRCVVDSEEVLRVDAIATERECVKLIDGFIAECRSAGMVW